MDQTNLADDIRQITELLRGDFERSGYGPAIQPVTVRTSAEHGGASS